jgi:hypothetical protein
VFLIRSRDESFAQSQTWHSTSFRELNGRENEHGNVSKQIRLSCAQPEVTVNHKGQLLEYIKCVVDITLKTWCNATSVTHVLPSASTSNPWGM